MDKIPYEDELLSLKDGEATIIIIKGRPFIVRPANDDDMKTAMNGCECVLKPDNP